MPGSHGENREEPDSWVAKWLQTGRMKTLKTLRTKATRNPCSVAFVASVGDRADHTSSHNAAKPFNRRTICLTQVRVI